MIFKCIILVLALLNAWLTFKSDAIKSKIDKRIRITIWVIVAIIQGVSMMLDVGWL